VTPSIGGVIMGRGGFVRAIPRAGGAMSAALILMVIWLGVYPIPLVHLIEVTAAQLVVK